MGTMPSPRSREAGFYYMHPQNRFWRVLGDVLGEMFPDDIDGKKRMLIKQHIALWDVLKSCDIIGAGDSTIKNEAPNDIDMILKTADIKHIFVTGRAAEKYFKREYTLLYSPSPANCAVSYDKMIANYSIIREKLYD